VWGYHVPTTCHLTHCLGDGDDDFAVVWCSTAHWWGAGCVHRVGRSGSIDVGGTCRGVWWGQAPVWVPPLAVAALLCCSSGNGDDDNNVIVVVVYGTCGFPVGVHR
jgi:hypothetical protein